MNRVELAEEMIAQGGRVHLIGVGGIGMAGVAFLLKARDFIVSGCDLVENRQTRWLQKNDIELSTGHHAGHIDESIDWLIRSTAVPDTHPEVQAAQAIGIPVSRRGEVLPALMRNRTCIAVSGTHGKTTTTAMIAQLLDCGYCIGGEVSGWEGVARDGDLMVVEADESDGTVAGYTPDYSVITNIEYDHMEHHASEAAFMNCFESFIENTAKEIYYCADDPLTQQVVEASQSTHRCIPYTLPDESVEVSLPGHHNRWNAGAALAVCQHWKSAQELRRLLRSLRPIRRRFEMVYDDQSIRIISDYAHHPTEIAALIQTARELQPQRVLAVFQPHRYTRTLALGRAFATSFSGIDRLWMLPVYAASEAPLEGGTTRDLMSRFSAEWDSNMEYCATNTEAWSAIKEMLQEGDLLLIIGAGDIEEIAEWARHGLK